MCKGAEDWIAEELLKETIAHIRSLMKNAGFTAEKAMELLDVPVNDRARYLAAI